MSDTPDFLQPPELPQGRATTPVPHRILNGTLSWDAIGLFVAILALFKPHERFFQADLIRFSGATDGEYVMRSAFKELTRAGLIKHRFSGGQHPGYWHEENVDG